MKYYNSNSLVRKATLLLLVSFIGLAVNAQESKDDRSRGPEMKAASKTESGQAKRTSGVASDNLPSRIHHAIKEYESDQDDQKKKKQFIKLRGEFYEYVEETGVDNLNPEETKLHQQFLATDDPKRYQELYGSSRNK